MKRILPYITFFILISAQTAGQTSKISYELFDNWMIGGSGGMSYLAMEMKKDLTQATMDMNSLPDLTYSFHLTKRINKKYDVGVEHRKSYFNGYKNYSSNVVWLMHSNRFNSDIVDFHPNPIYYKTYISMWALDAKLNFPNFYSVEKSEMNANLYLRASSGISYIGVELGYKNMDDYAGTNLRHPLYEKGQGAHKRMDAYWSHSLGFGFLYQASHRWSVFTEVSLLLVSCDYLDGVHNYILRTQSDQTQTIQRVGVYDTIGILRFGFNYHFNFKIAGRKNKKETWKKTDDRFSNKYYHDRTYNTVKPPYLPFSWVDNVKKK